MTIDRLYRNIVVMDGPAQSRCWVRKRAPTVRKAWKVNTGTGSMWARRWVWLHFLKRPILAGHLVSTACGNPACVNPEHLLTVTKADVSSENRQREGAWRAHRNPNRKVNWEIVGRIRRNAAKGVPALMADSGLGRLAVRRILSGERWRAKEPAPHDPPRPHRQATL